MTTPGSKRTVRFVPRQREPEMDMFAEGAACALAENHETRMVYHQVLGVIVEETQANGETITQEVGVYVREEETSSECAAPAATQAANPSKPTGGGGKKRG